MERNQELFKNKREKLEKPVHFIYRDNSSFQKLIPVIESAVVGSGGTVVYHVFPEGTPEVDIEQFLRENQPMITTEHTLMDTTSMAINRLKIQGEERPGVGELDWFADHAARVAIETMVKEKRLNSASRYDEARDTPEGKEQYLADLGEMYTLMLGKLDAALKQMPFIIVTGMVANQSALSHIPLIAHEPFRPQEHERFQKAEQMRVDTLDFAERMQQWFHNAGIMDVSIISTCTELTDVQIQQLLDKKAAIVFDRHTSAHDPSRNESPELKEYYAKFWGASMEVSKTIKETAALQTPIATFLCDLEEKFQAGIVPNDARDAALKQQTEREMIGFFEAESRK